MIRTGRLSMKNAGTPFLAAVSIVAIAACSGTERQRAPEVDAGLDVDSTGGDESDAGDAAIDDEPSASWHWNDVPLPGVDGSDCPQLSIVALENDDVLICYRGYDYLEGGIMRFNSETLHTEVSDQPCRHILGTSSNNVWAVNAGTIIRRRDGRWVTDTPEGLFDDLFLERLFDIGQGVPGILTSDMRAKRQLWFNEGQWTQSRFFELPSMDRIEHINGAFIVDEGLLFYGSGLEEGDGLFTSTVELEYPEEHALWVDGESLDSFYALGHDGLWIYRNGWTYEHCPAHRPFPETTACWDHGVLTTSGDVYLGGGYGSCEPNIDNWRLHRWDGAAFTELLEPCEAASPHCSVRALDATDDRLYVLVIQEFQASLLWTELPD